MREACRAGAFRKIGAGFNTGGMKHIKKGHPFVVAMIGAVGSGKSYVAARLSRALGAVHLRTDDVRVRLRRHGRPMHRAIPLLERRAEALLRHGKSIILDSDFINPIKRRDLQRKSVLFGAKLYFISIDAPERLILARLRKKRYTSRDLFRNAEHAVRTYHIRKKFHDKHQGFRPDFTVDNAKPLEPQIEEFVRHIRDQS